MHFLFQGKDDRVKFFVTFISPQIFIVIWQKKPFWIKKTNESTCCFFVTTTISIDCLVLCIFKRKKTKKIKDVFWKYKKNIAGWFSKELKNQNQNAWCFDVAKGFFSVFKNLLVSTHKFLSLWFCLNILYLKK